MNIKLEKAAQECAEKCASVEEIIDPELHSEAIDRLTPIILAAMRGVVPKSDHWISVDEELPPPGLEVMACSEYGNLMLAYCYGGRWTCSRRVTKWHQLPTLPDAPSTIAGEMEKWTCDNCGREMLGRKDRMWCSECLRDYAVPPVNQPSETLESLRRERHELLTDITVKAGKIERLTKERDEAKLRCSEFSIASVRAMDDRTSDLLKQRTEHTQKITALTTTNARMRAALEPFAEVNCGMDDDAPIIELDISAAHLTLGHCRAAKAALESGPDPVAELRAKSDMTKEWDELHDRLWARDPALAGACLDLIAAGRRRLEAQKSHLTAFFSCLDGIHEIKNIPGSVFDGNRDAHAIRAIVNWLIERAEVGRKWREDSSLETWFPITAQQMQDLRAECERLEKDARELKKIAADSQDDAAICRAENTRFRRELKEGVGLIDSATKMHDDLQSKLGTVEKECERLRGELKAKGGV